MIFNKCHRFNPKTSKGLIAKIEKTLDTHSSFLENIKEGRGLVLVKNASGGITIESTATGGAAADGCDYAFKTTAVANPLQEGQTEADQTYTVTVLDGSAQVLGGEERLFDKVTVGDVPNDSYVYVKYDVWDGDGVAACEWVDGIQVSMGEEPPADDEGAKSLVFAIAKIGLDYVGNVNQYRLGSIQGVAVMNASPEVSEVYGIEAISGDVDD